MMEWDIDFVKRFGASYKKYARPDWKKHIENFNHQQAPSFLLDFKHVLDKGSLKFWLIWGTALGAYRDGRIIPYDHDMDVAILYGDREKLLGCTPSLIAVDIVPWVIGVRPDGIWFRYGRKDCFVDVVLFQKNGHEYRCMKWGMELRWLDEEKRVTFLGESFLLPSEPEKYFEAKYGKNWRTPIENHHCVS